jgi:predicted ATP-dependent protease
MFVNKLILPQKNEADVEEIPEDVRKELEIITANRIDDVLNAALESQPSEPVGKNYAIPDMEPHSDAIGESLIAKEK